MAKKKKRTVMRPKQPAVKNTKSRKAVRLSQCMIVKNEESNIERALSWGRGIVCEQIVVDTGSTDRTVEIAESMGAKVYHFEWIDDFSAARNYAIEQATGDWIAFLDADEYFSREDAEQLPKCLEFLETFEEGRKTYMLMFTLVNIGDDGKAFSMHIQERIFRNRPDIRYVGSIHEYIPGSDGRMSLPNLTVVHTGYSNSAFEQWNKRERNLTMIKKEYEKDREDPKMMCYLADSLRIGRKGNEDEELIQSLYMQALNSERENTPELVKSAYNYLITTSAENDLNKAKKLALRSLSKYPDNPDFNFYLGFILSKMGEFREAWNYLKKSEELLKGSATATSYYAAMYPKEVFFQMLTTADALNDRTSVIHYATLLIKEDKTQRGILAPYISALKQPETNISDEEVVELLKKLYDFTSVRDKLLIMQAAMDAECTGIAKLVMDSLTPEEREFLTGS